MNGKPSLIPPEIGRIAAYRHQIDQDGKVSAANFTEVAVIDCVDIISDE